jgi:hypothetical protein
LAPILLCRADRFFGGFALCVCVCWPTTTTWDRQVRLYFWGGYVKTRADTKSSKLQGYICRERAPATTNNHPQFSSFFLFSKESSSSSNRNKKDQITSAAGPTQKITIGGLHLFSTTKNGCPVVFNNNTGTPWTNASVYTRVPRNKCPIERQPCTQNRNA